MLKRAVCELKSLSAYSQSKRINVPKKEKETHADYEERTWRDRCHRNDDGYVMIPPMAFANSIKQAAKFLGIPIPGQGKARYTKHFESGVMVLDPLILPIKWEDVQGEWWFLPADGVRGSGKRVDKCFPVIPQWEGTVTYEITDPAITERVFLRTLLHCGSATGIGRFRPANWGYYGRFTVVDWQWKEVDDEDLVDALIAA